MRIDETREKSRFTSKGSITLNNECITYTTVCEDTFLYDDENNAIATIFSYAYFRENTEEKNRPVLFAFNGGPGSSSLWVHAGIIGPRRVKIEDEIHIPTTPPFELEDNPHCLLDFCDLVVIDCVGTGYSRLFDETKKEELYDTDKDVSALALFIEQWLNRYNRRNSPIFLAGESYGTGRAALLVGELLGAGPTKSEILGISVSGVMLLGSTFFAPLPAEEDALDLLAMAATYHYHKPEGKEDRNTFIENAWNFVKKEYVPALFEGDALALDEKEKVAQKLEYFTGIPKKSWMVNRLRMDTFTYSQKVLEDDGLYVGFYDSRYTWAGDPCIKNANVIADDPAMGRYTPAFQAAFSLLKEELDITFDRTSKGLVFDVNESWNRKFKTKPADSLAAAMRRNPSLKVFFASGLYDLCTTAGHSRYLATHSNLDLTRVKIGEYPSGHMAYLGEESATLLGKDMREFFKDCLNHK